MINEQDNGFIDFWLYVMSVVDKRLTQIGLCLSDISAVADT